MMFFCFINLLHFTIIDGRSIALASAAYTCNGPCIPANSENMQMSDLRRQLLTDTIAKELSVTTTFEGGSVRITYFRGGQQGVITAVCSAGVAVGAEGNVCSEFYSELLTTRTGIWNMAILDYYII